MHTEHVLYYPIERNLMSQQTGHKTQTLKENSITDKKMIGVDGHAQNTSSAEYTC